MQRPRVGRLIGRVEGRVGLDEPAEQHGTLAAAHEWRVPEAARSALLSLLCLLPATYYLLLTTYNSLLSTYYTLLTARYLPEAVERVARVAQLLLELLGGGRAPTLLLGGGGLSGFSARELRHE
eukprot:scaffold45981_cov72-Phaeocystis_antarctica.AAC.2